MVKMNTNIPQLNRSPNILPVFEILLNTKTQCNPYFIFQQVKNNETSLYKEHRKNLIYGIVWEGINKCVRRIFIEMLRVLNHITQHIKH